MMTLAEIIIEYRHSHGLSQRKFAEKCDVSNGYISMLENGENPKTGKAIVPTLDSLQKIARVMGMTVDELLTQADEIEVDISKKPASEDEDGLDSELMKRLTRLTPEELRKVDAFVQGLLAAREG